MPLIRTVRPSTPQVGAELLLPERPAKDDDRVAAGHLIFVGAKVAANGRGHAHQREQVAAGEDAELQPRLRIRVRRKSDGDAR